MTKFIDTSGFDNVEQVRKWYLGIQSTFKQIQKQNNYRKKQAWDKLIIELFKSDKGKSFTKEEAIDLMVSLSATDANSEKKWRGFYNSLSQTELQGEWDEYWKP